MFYYFNYDKILLVGSETMNELELAGALILDDEKKLLLIHRSSKKRTQWELPGGKVEKNEDIKDAAVRELKEELDVDINITKYLGSDISIEDDVTLKYHWFLAYVSNGTPRLVEDKFDDMKYFSKDELLMKEDLSSNMKVLVKKIDITKINY